MDSQGTGSIRQGGGEGLVTQIRAWRPQSNMIFPLTVELFSIFLILGLNILCKLV